MLKNGDLLFIAGIHGVGKTTYCKRVFNNYESISCSSLISKYINLNKNKLTENINENQKILEKAFNKYVDISKNVVLDGHFCLLNANKEIIKIDKEVFRNLKLKKIIILYNDSKEIQKNLLNRDGIFYDLDLIENFQNEEILYGKTIAHDMGVSVQVIKSY